MQFRGYYSEVTEKSAYIDSLDTIWNSAYQHQRHDKATKSWYCSIVRLSSRFWPKGRNPASDQTDEWLRWEVWEKWARQMWVDGPSCADQANSRYCTTGATRRQQQDTRRNGTCRRKAWVWDGVPQECTIRVGKLGIAAEKIAVGPSTNDDVPQHFASKYKDIAETKVLLGWTVWRLETSSWRAETRLWGCFRSTQQDSSHARTSAPRTWLLGDKMQEHDAMEQRWASYSKWRKEVSLKLERGTEINSCSLQEHSNEKYSEGHYEEDSMWLRRCTWPSWEVHHVKEAVSMRNASARFQRCSPDTKRSSSENFQIEGKNETVALPPVSVNMK